MPFFLVLDDVQADDFVPLAHSLADEQIDDFQLGLGKLAATSSGTAASCAKFVSTPPRTMPSANRAHYDHRIVPAIKRSSA
jgi:hypothetical protein